MGIDNIKDVLSGEMEKAVEASNFVRINSVRDQVMHLLNNPDEETGDPLKWTNVQLRLKPEMYLLTGIPSMGKSTWLDNVIINSIMAHDYKWAIFSPESHPIELHIKQMIEICTKSNFSGRYGARKTDETEVDHFMREMNNNLIFLTPDEEHTKIEEILSIFEYLVENHNIKNFILDPYNEFSHTRPLGMSETEYVSRFLGRVRKFINKHKAAVWIVAHPTKLRKEDVIFADGSKGLDYPVPTAYDIAGSANFFNKPDNIIAVHRDKDKNRNPFNIVSINVQKVRRKTSGQLGSYLIKFDYPTGTYEEIDREY